MECRTLELTLISARDLPHVRQLLKMKVYAEISIEGQSDSAYTTPTDEDGETNPYWSFKIKYVFPEKAVHDEGNNIFIKLYCKRSLKYDKYVGRVILSLKGLFDSGLEEEDREFDIDCKDAKDGFPKLKLSYKFGKTPVIAVDLEEKFKKNDDIYQKMGAMSGIAGLAVAVVGVGVKIIMGGV